VVLPIPSIDRRNGGERRSVGSKHPRILSQKLEPLSLQKRVYKYKTDAAAAGGIACVTCDFGLWRGEARGGEGMSLRIIWERQR
jgi:hypothetical protein